MMKKIFLTAGVFDLLHYGHYELFRRIKEMAGAEGVLTVALQEDEWVAKYKDVKLVYNWQQRKNMIAAIRYVNDVVPYTAIDQSIKDIPLDVFVVGEDQCHSGFQAAMRWCREQDKEVFVMPRTKGISTTDLKKCIKNM